jgi:hypothetical protein
MFKIMLTYSISCGRLLEIPRKEIFRQSSPEKVQRAHNQHHWQHEGAGILSPITEDMKIASLSSLEKIRRKREQYERFVVEDAGQFQKSNSVFVLEKLF